MIKRFAFVLMIGWISWLIPIGSVNAAIGKRKIKIIFSLHTALPPLISDEEIPQEEPMPGDEDSSQSVDKHIIYRPLSIQEDSLLKRKELARIQQLFSPWSWRIGHQVFSFTTDTVEIALEDQLLDTLFIRKTAMGKDTSGYYLLKFRHGFVYRIALDLEETSWSIQPTIPQQERSLLVSFQLRNYPGKDKILAIAGEIQQDKALREEIVLKNNTKTRYYKAASANRWYSWGNAGFYRLTIINQSQLDKKRKIVNPYIVIPFQELHAEQLDVSYDFKTKKFDIGILN